MARTAARLAGAHAETAVSVALELTKLTPVPIELDPALAAHLRQRAVCRCLCGAARS